MRKTLLTLTLTALLASTLAVTPALASTTTDTLPPTYRIDGADRYDVSAKLSKRSNNATITDNVYLVSGVTFPDALSAASPAAQYLNAMLLTHPDTLQASTRTELQRLTPKTITLVGSEATITQNLANQAKAAVPGATIKRLAGADRYETSILVARNAYPNPTTAFLVSGTKFPDALSVSPVAAQLKAPVILVPKDGLPASTERWLRDMNLTSLNYVGGPENFGTTIEKARIAAGLTTIKGTYGPDRWTTNLLINQAVPRENLHTIYLASGENFPDALAVAPTAGKQSAPVFLTRGDCIPAVTLDRIKQYNPQAVQLIGGEPTLSQNVADLKTC